MKVVIFSKSSWNIYNFRKNLILNLIKKKIEIFVISNKDNYNKNLKKLGCRIVNVKFNNRGINIFKDIETFFNCYLIIRKIKPDYILNFNLKPIVLGNLVSRFLKVRTISTITGLGSMYLKSKLFKNLLIFVYKFVFTKKNIACFHNNFDQKIFLKNKVIDKKSSFITPGSGVDLKKFKFLKPKINIKTRFLFIGRLIWDKGIREYLYAANYFLKKYNYNCEFHIIGEFSENHKDGIISYNYLSRFPIKYHGFKKDVRTLIKKSDCIVLPSYREGSAKSLIESAAIGKPLIATNVPGCNNIVFNNINGYLCKKKNVDNLIKVLKKFIKLNRNHKKNMSIQSRKIAEEKFDEKIVISAYLKKLEKK